MFRLLLLFFLFLYYVRWLFSFVLLLFILKESKQWRLLYSKLIASKPPARSMHKRSSPSRRRVTPGARAYTTPPEPEIYAKTLQEYVLIDVRIRRLVPRDRFSDRMLINFQIRTS